MSKLTIFFTFVIIGLAQLKNGVQGERREEMFNDGSYAVGWEVDVGTGSVAFDLSVKTSGFVGFGISNGGGMSGADIFIGGVHSNGTIYYGDYHGIGNQAPILDVKQDWKLISGSENGTYTRLEFSRLLATCDENDVSLTGDTTYFIWSYGSTDEIGYHGSANRGTQVVTPLDPPVPDVDLSKYYIWEISRTTLYPSHSTTYWGTIHKMPDLVGTNYIVAFQPLLKSPLTKRHAHHLTIFKCEAPEGEDPIQFFDPMVGHVGWESHDDPESPLRYCGKMLYVWAVGGNGFVLPEHVGYPINERGIAEYYLFEVHFDNPEQLDGIEMEAGVQIYFTPIPREYDAGVAFVGYYMNTAQLIPPMSTDFTTVGHCASKCTQDKVPAAGLNVFNVFMHSHISGRKLRVRQFRDGIELPWLASDENYDFNYQQNRPFREERKIFPGDHLSYECVTDTTWRNGQVTLAGYSTSDEMCQSFLWYYPRTNFGCASNYANYTKFFNYFGIQSVELINDYDFDPIVTAPAQHANKRFSEVLNSFPPSFWTQELRDELQNELRYSQHDDISCGAGLVTYPLIDVPYVPPNPCDVTPTTPVPTTTFWTTTTPHSDKCEPGHTKTTTTTEVVGSESCPGMRETITVTTTTTLIV